MTDINKKLKLRKQRVVDEVIELLDDSYGYPEQKLEILSLVLAHLANRELEARLEEMQKQQFGMSH
jgi:hypothetical protein